MKARNNRAGATLTKSNGNGHVPRSKKRAKGKEGLKTTLLGTDPTRDYQSSRFSYYGELFVQQIPQWRLWTGRMMLSSDPIVNFSLNIRNAALSPGEIRVTAKNPRVKKWVEEQWNFLWNHHAPKLIDAKKWGFAPLQVLYKEDAQGLVCIKGLKDFAPEDARALEVRSRLVGHRIKSNKIFFPQALWIKFNAQHGSHYGTGCLRKSYPAWYEKWMDHGAKRLLQLRMIKDAYIGDIFWYPPNMMVEIPDNNGGSIKLSYRDLMRELGENRLSGGALTMPMLYDNNGKELTKYTPPQDVGYGSQIFDWNDKCDEGILWGADVPSEVVKAADTGSGYSGRSIPFLVLLSTCTQEFKDIVQCVDAQVLRPTAWLNFGGEPEYEIEVVSLVESFSQDTSGSPMGGGAIGGQPSQQPAPQQVQQAPTSQQAVQYGEDEDEGDSQYVEFDDTKHLRAPPKGVTIHGVKYKGGEFIPKEVIDALTPEEQSKLRAGTIARHIKANPGLSEGARKPPGSQMPEELKQKLREFGMVGTFPPADVPMSNLKIADFSLGKDALKNKPLISWNQTTKSGRKSGQYRYTQEFIDKNAAGKFDRVASIEPHLPAIAKSLTQILSDPKEPQVRRESAAIASIIRETGLRPTDGNDSVKHGHFGISSLQGRHAKVKGNEIYLDFIGKEGVRNKTVIKEPANVAFVKAALEGTGPKDFIFKQAHSGTAGDLLKEVSQQVGGPEDIKVKDLRTLKATQVARKVVANYNGPPPPLTGNQKKDVKAIKAAILKMSGEVSSVLNNTPTQARDNYIHPEIFKQWQSTLAS